MKKYALMNSLRYIVLLASLFLCCENYGQLIPVQNSGAGITGTWNILVIPVEFTNWTHNKPIGADNPYLKPIDTHELRMKLDSLATGYYLITSRGKCKMNFKVFPMWNNIGKTMQSYAGSSTAGISLLTDGISKYGQNRASKGWPDESTFDKTIIAFAGPNYADEWNNEWTGTGWNVGSDFIRPIAYPAGSNGKASCASIYDGAGVYTHEMGHQIFMLKDMVYSNKIPGYRYQLMGAGAWNGCNIKNPDAYQGWDSLKNTIPSLLPPWERVNLQWERQPYELSAGSNTSKLLLAPAADTTLISDNKYRNLIAIKQSPGKFFILENRYKNGWDIAMPDWGILIWYIDDSKRSTADASSDYSKGVWDRIIDAHPNTTDNASPYKYNMIDQRTATLGSYTENSVTYYPRGLYDAPIHEGENLALPGTNVQVSFLKRLTNGSIYLQLENVNLNVTDDTSFVVTDIAQTENPNGIPGLAYPNPSLLSPINIPYTITENCYTTLQIFDISGKILQTLVDKIELKGNYITTWNIKNENEQSVPSGIYFCRMISGSNISIIKLVVIE